MRHRKKFNHLGRKTAHRAAMLSNMSCSLILHKRINTTLAKAKALRVYVEPLITKAKSDDTHNRRVVFSRLKDKQAVAMLFNEVSTKVGSRPGGYIRIIKMGNRLGDNASMAMVELVDFNETYQPNQQHGKAKKSSTRRSRSSSKASVENKTNEEVVEEAANIKNITPIETQPVENPTAVETSTPAEESTENTSGVDDDNNSVESEGKTKE